jgi:hypothetical protein
MKISARWPGQLSWLHGPAANSKAATLWPSSARISRIRGMPAELIGYVEALDEEQAIKQAIKQFEIRDPEKQKRLLAQRVT